MAEREIKIRSFTWREEIENPVTGKVGAVTRQAAYGSVVDLPDHAIERGEALNAFFTDEDRAEADATEDETYLQDMDDEELAEWVSSSTIPQVVNAANDDPDLAQRLLDAENAATGNDPRNGLVEGLAKVLGSTE